MQGVLRNSSIHELCHAHSDHLSLRWFHAADLLDALAVLSSSFARATDEEMQHLSYYQQQQQHQQQHQHQQHQQHQQQQQQHQLQHLNQQLRRPDVPSAGALTADAAHTTIAANPARTAHTTTALPVPAGWVSQAGHTALGPGSPTRPTLASSLHTLAPFSPQQKHPRLHSFSHTPCPPAHVVGAAGHFAQMSFSSLSLSLSLSHSHSLSLTHTQTQIHTYMHAHLSVGHTAPPLATMSLHARTKTSQIVKGSAAGTRVRVLYCKHIFCKGAGMCVHKLTTTAET